MLTAQGPSGRGGYRGKVSELCCQDFQKPPSSPPTPAGLVAKLRPRQSVERVGGPVFSQEREEDCLDSPIPRRHQPSYPTPQGNLWAL